MQSPEIKRNRLGNLLIKRNLITECQLNEVLQLQKEQGGKIGDHLIKLGYIDESQLLMTIAEQLDLPYIDLKHYEIKHEMVQKLPERLARRYRAIVIDKVSDQYLVGMHDPTDVIAYDEMKRYLNERFRVAVVSESDLFRVIDMVYRKTKDIASFAHELKEEIGVSTEDDAESEKLGAESAPVARLLDSIFEDAIMTRASDIHIEPDETHLRIRQRIDGVLQEHLMREKEITAALVLRIKLTAKLNIAEKRIPQDGRIMLSIKGNRIDVRVATMPVQHGEAVVMRLLDQTRGIRKLDQLGIPDPILQRLNMLIHKPHGLILVTGPTGSGKTTTLYSALNELNSSEKKIITIEDPVEYTIPRINQVQVNPVINLTFASVLRATLRHDPDVVMVGEMRDEETAQTGLRAAMTGHLVFSTLHTNDAISSTVRLIDMGIKGFLVAAALKGVVAQRLVRKICSACSQTYQPTDIEKTWLKAMEGEQAVSAAYKKGSGCNRCNNTGYRERIGIYELLEMDGPLADTLRTNDTTAFTHLAAKQKGFRPLHLAALDYAKSGITTIHEVFRIAGESFEMKE